VKVNSQCSHRLTLVGLNTHHSRRIFACLENFTGAPYKYKPTNM
jgi:hypothetical protein